MTTMKKVSMKYLSVRIATVCGVAGMLVVLMSACSKGKSYSELLREEERACNWYLAQQTVRDRLPENEDEIEVGPDAPFYKMDKDGYIYMQIVDKGDAENGFESGDRVYFRFMRRNIKDMWKGYAAPAEGNADNLSDWHLGPTSFVYGSLDLESTGKYGSGIQVPLEYVGNYSEVNLVLESYYGFSVDKSDCLPYIINLRYFKAEY